MVFIFQEVTMLTEYFRNYTTLFNKKFLKALGKNKADIFVGSLLLRNVPQLVMLYI